MENLKKREIVTIASVATLLSFTIFLLGPGHLYYHNILEFPFAFSSILFTLLSLSLASSTLITLIVVPLVNLKLHRYVISLLFGICLALWLQGNLLLWDYGLLDGKSIDWQSKSSYGIIDSSLWVGILLVSLLKSQFTYKYLKKGCIILFAIQLTSLFILVSAKESPSWTKYVADDKSKFHYSFNKNIIVLVIDTFQTDVFQEIIDENIQYKNIFDGFTYFRNSVGGYPTTYPSVPLLLTGQYYDNSIPIQDFFKKAYLSNSIPFKLKRLGYDVYLPIKNYIYCDTQIASNLSFKRDLFHFKIKEIAPLLSFTLFRYSPHYIKEILFGRPQKLIHATNPDMSINADIKFLQKMMKQSEVSVKSNVFKFYHLRGLHDPLPFDENLQFKKIPQNRLGYIKSAKGVLKITNDFLNTLKRLKTYDNSMIVIVADHGTGTPEYMSGTSNDDMAYLNPLILVKSFSARGQLIVSDAPVTLADLPDTIFHEIDATNEDKGNSMFHIKESSSRKRSYFSYDWAFDNWRDEYMPPLREYFISGHSWKIDSWEKSFRNLTPSGIKSENNHYLFGKEIVFDDSANYDLYKEFGWSKDILMGNRWINGSYASLTLQLPQTKSDLTLKASLMPVIDNQRVNIKINDLQLGQWMVNARGTYQIDIPNTYFSDKQKLKIAFQMPNARPIKKDGIISSIAIKSLTLNERH